MIEHLLYVWPYLEGYNSEQDEVSAFKECISIMGNISLNSMR